MPILTKEVEVKINAKTVKYYESLGYEIPMKKASDSHRKRFKKDFTYDFGKTIIVKIEDLTKGSNIDVEILCDACMKNTMTVPYYRYYDYVQKTGSYVCKDCIPEKRKNTLYDRYGVYNPSQVEDFKEKRIQTNLERYGVPYYAQTKECHDKAKATLLNRYGVSHNSQLPDYREKYNETCISRYGERYSEQFVKKAFETFRERTGYDYPLQSPIVKERVVQSYINHYGVDHPNKLPEFRERRQKTCLERYGYMNPSQSPEIRAKMSKTLYANSSQKTSKQQLYLFNLYKSINPSTELNYPISHFNADICLPNEKIEIEYDGGFHNGTVQTGKITQEEFDRKELIRDKIIKSEGYRIIRIKSDSDKLPQDSILLQMLSEAKQYFSKYLNHSWVEYNLDTSTLRNAEHKDGIPYSFGELRRIKDKDTTKDIA